MIKIRKNFIDKDLRIYDLYPIETDWPGLSRPFVALCNFDAILINLN